MQTTVTYLLVFPKVSKIAGWDFEHAKKCLNFLGPAKDEQLPVNSIVKALQEKLTGARESLADVNSHLRLAESSAESAKRRLTHTNLSFSAPEFGSDRNWKDWDEKMTEVLNLKKSKSKAETYIRLCEEKVKMEEGPEVYCWDTVIW